MSKRCSVIFWHIPAPDRNSRCSCGSNFPAKSATFSTALLYLRCRSGHRFAIIYRHGIQQTFHIHLIQLNMPPEIINTDATFEKMNFVTHNSSHLHQEIFLEFSLPTLPNWMLIHTPENRRHAVPGTNYHKTVCEYTGWCGSVGKTYLSRACRMRTLANALMLSSFHSLLHWVAKILNSWHLKALSQKMCSSVRACINATLMSTTSLPKSLQLAALANKVMKNVSGFLTNKSSMRHSALNWRTRSRDLTRSPRHSSTQQTMSWACFPGGNSSTNSSASKFNMFRNSSSRPAFNSPSGWIVHWVQCDLGWGRQMACHKEICWHPQCTPPVNSHFLQWILAQILPSWVSAVKLDAPPGLITGSPIFLFFKLTSSSCTISSWFPDLSSLVVSPLSTISCSILARHSSVCCPFPTQPGHPLVRPYLSKMFYHKCTLCARLPISNSSFRWIVVSAACSLLSLRGLPTHRFQNCTSQPLLRRITQVFQSGFFSKSFYECQVNSRLVTILTSQVLKKKIMNLVDRDLTEHQITQTLTYVTTGRTTGADSDCSLTRNKLTGADKVNPTV